MRRFIRHPADIPIDFSVNDTGTPAAYRMKDVSLGGLCFTTDKPMQRGVQIRLNIPILARLTEEPSASLQRFEADGVVAWCRREGQSYSVGVQFADQSTQFGVRMVEQICHIEHYRYDIAQAEGRILSSEEAAKEWIDRYAAEFPH